MDVINGPLAVAGSNFNLSNTNGKDIPIKLPTMTITIIVKATTTATSKPPRTTPITETAAAIVTPIKAATESSLVNILNQSLIFTSDRKSTRLNSSHGATTYAASSLK